MKTLLAAAILLTILSVARTNATPGCGIKSDGQYHCGSNCGIKTDGNYHCGHDCGIKSDGKFHCIDDGLTSH